MQRVKIYMGYSILTNKSHVAGHMIKLGVLPKIILCRKLQCFQFFRADASLDELKIWVLILTIMGH